MCNKFAKKLIYVGRIKSLFGQTLVYGLSSIVPKFLNYLLAPLQTHFFAKQEYGVITELYAYVTFLNIIITFGLETGYFLFAGNKKKDVVFGTCFTTVASLALTFLLSIIIFSKEIANALDYGSNPEFILFFAFIISIDALTAIPFAKLRQENRPLRFAFLKIFSVFVNVFLNVFFLIIFPKIKGSGPSIFDFLYTGSGLQVVFISNLVSSSIILLILLPDIIKEKIRFSFVLWRELMLYSFPLLIAQFAGNINEAMDRVMLKHLLPSNVNGMEQLGIYGANVRIAVLLAIFTQMFRFAAEPFFFKTAKDGDAKNVFADVAKYFFIFGLIIFLFIMFYIDIWKHFIDSRYWEGLSVVPVLLMSNLLLGVYFNLSMWYKLNKWTKYGAYIAIIGSLVTVILNILLIPLWGYFGCAVTRIVCYVSMIAISYYWSRKHYLIKYNFKLFFVYLALAIGLFSITFFYSGLSSVFKMSLNTILFCIFIGFVLWKERELLRMLKSTFINRTSNVSP